MTDELDSPAETLLSCIGAMQSLLAERHHHQLGDG